MTNPESIFGQKAVMRLTESFTSDEEQNNHLVYGIEIVEMINDMECRRFIFDISTCKGKMEAFLENLMLGDVDHIQLDFLIEDFLSF